MDRREIQSKGAALQKAIQAKEPVDSLLTILRDLKANVKPTEELLRATQIGKIVNKVKGYPGLDPQVTQLASEIISRWRHIVNEQKLTSGSSTPNGARSNGTSSPAPKAATPQPKAVSPTGVAPDKRSWKVDKVPRDDLTNDTARNNCIGLIYDGLCIGSELPMKQILALAKEIESAALQLPAAKGSSNSPIYKDKIRSLYQNLKNKSNPGLRKRILVGEVTPVRFVSMSHEEMKSKQQREEDQKIAKENMNNAMVAQEEKSVSTSLECGKCHQKKVSYSQAQTRSADEPMTTFCECLNCGNRWKFS
ncbi:transcription elongation factor S-II, variant [Exophiala mesophila]|uniref:Transcription elongation factor n=1 Tax=Exophiala mesophila TaxID=212818 RepID=A0A0D1XU54_EXOME|nr:transcription elongation factor S-II [Exophiala mesophila]XP_016223300.1 transcription elongation factor S-II, variant [Exophiala mesophila]KIV91725.1 transcription elongation factor S-II [Exophiala mesophila]KIV91726.1 transcription elongation factor S-II, variant [Exophiala mesophila]